MQVATRIISIALFLWMGWNFVVMSLDLIKSKEVTPVFRLPYYPISFGLAFCLPCPMSHPPFPDYEDCRRPA